MVLHKIFPVVLLVLATTFGNILDESNITADALNEMNDNIVQSEYIFPPIFVLNLDRSKERWIAASQAMHDANLNVQRLSAVDGRLLSQAELLNVSTRMAAYFQPRGVIGCYLSHRKFWQLVVDRGYESAIVFEDDVKLIDNFRETLQESLMALSASNILYDVALLGAIGMVHPEGKHGFGARLFSAYIGGARPLVQKNDRVYQPNRPAGTHAYMVSNAGARKLLKLCPKAVFHVDLDAWRHQGLQIYMFRPMLAYQTFEATSLTDVIPNRGIMRVVKNSKLVSDFKQWAADPYTLQPWSHVLDEPLLQCGPKGLVLTVERHMMVVVGGTILAGILERFGPRGWGRKALGATAAFVFAVRSTIWLLMNWK